jgi:uncharacterized SAM-binding protein YcdF (DUF218 family)
MAHCYTLPMTETLSNSRDLILARRKEVYEHLCDGRPDALFILGHDVVKNRTSGEFKSGSYGHTDPIGRIGGAKARSIAATELHRHFPRATLVANSWSEYTGEYVSHARITADELKVRGVSESDIIVQENSYSTFTELLELVRLVVDNGWHHVVAIANEFQIPRAQAMLERIGDLHDPKGESRKPRVRERIEKFLRMSARITFVSAEDVLSKKDARFKKIIDAARQLPDWRATTQRDLKAAQKVRDGEYWKDPPDWEKP